MLTSVRNYYIFFLIVIFLSCQKKTPGEIILKGYITNLTGQKIYITDANDWEVFIDSALCKNGKFEFALDTSKYDPFLASICYLDKRGEIKQISVINYKRTNGKDTFANTGFRLSFGTTEISGDHNDRFHRVSLKPNSENDLYFDPKIENYWGPKNISSVERAIFRNPQSYFLLQKTHQTKHLFQKAQLKKLLSLFDEKILLSPYAKEIDGYADFILENEQLPASIILNNEHSGMSDLFYDSPKLSMLVFWASWCGPCRMEIPQLKSLYANFEQTGIVIKSISIDEDSLNWKKAVKEEKMPWQQFLIPHKDIIKIKAQFLIGAVPTVVFVSRDRTIVKKFVGFSEKNVEEYKYFITEYLTKDSVRRELRQE